MSVCDQNCLTRGWIQEQTLFQVLQLAGTSGSLSAIVASLKEKESPYTRSGYELCVGFSGTISVRDTLDFSSKFKREENIQVEERESFLYLRGN